MHPIIMLLLALAIGMSQALTDLAIHTQDKDDSTSNAESFKSMK
jgi:hypothetical protein